MSSHYDVIIAGAGSFGMSAGYYLALAGVRVLLIDAGDPPHSLGSHHGSTRIVRTAYTMGAAYVKLALRAQQLWKQLEEQSAELRTADEAYHGPLFERTGAISVGPSGSAFIRSKTDSCTAFSIPHRLLTASDIRREWPGLSVSDSMEGLYEPEAGVLYSERIIRVLRQLALAQGAELLAHTQVHGIEAGSGGHAVHTSNGSFTADRVLVSAGAWAGRLFPELAAVTPIRKAVGWFEAPNPLYGAERLPVFIINNGGDEEYFGFPDLDGSGLKIGRHDGGREVLYGQPLPAFGTYKEDEDELRFALERFLPGAGRLRDGQVCLYERSPGERFWLGEVPGRTGVWFAGGGSGHGFKFASAIGEAMSLALTGRQAESDLDWPAFSLPSSIK
ncbi:N-methyl-L-tryptophan oxidase [Paenibacillus hodogayensis]|uniref:N-methyl-L-tryptophan oxidase n=1 Tax=Paenibacillus hodogayensis TaxID=279208 RepID=A0ABV5VQ80_9BACL